MVCPVISNSGFDPSCYSLPSAKVNAGNDSNQPADLLLTPIADNVFLKADAWRSGGTPMRKPVILITLLTTILAIRAASGAAQAKAPAPAAVQTPPSVQTQPAAPPLRLVQTFTLPALIVGHFDHFAVDLDGGRLFSAAEGAKAVLVFDLATGQLTQTITGIEIPHAILYRHDLDRLYVTDGGEGALKIFDAKTYGLLLRIPLFVDADSIVYSPATHQLFVVNGGGDAHQSSSTITMVDTTKGERLGDIEVDGDTLEAMALEDARPRLYSNNRAKNRVEMIDLDRRTVVASWPVTRGKVNVAMALDEKSHRLFVGCRSGQIVVMDTETGKELQTLPIDQGVDDL